MSWASCGSRIDIPESTAHIHGFKNGARPELRDSDDFPRRKWSSNGVLYEAM